MGLSTAFLEQFEVLTTAPVKPKNDASVYRKKLTHLKGRCYSAAE
jgi:hypothetical protein